MTQWLHVPQQFVRPEAKQLQQFALLLPVAVYLTCWSIGIAWPPTAIAVAVSGALALAGWYFPNALLKPIFISASLVALPIGWIVGELVLLVIYFGLVTPISLVFCILRRDALERTIERSAKSYWRAKPHPRPPSSYLRRW